MGNANLSTVRIRVGYELAAGLEELEARTRKALEQGVTGVPTFMLSRWPFGGIQNDDTMRTVLTRFAARQRERAGADAARGEVG